MDAKGVRVMNYKKWFVFFVLLVALMLSGFNCITSENVLPEGLPGSYNVAVTSLVYNVATDRFDMTWTPATSTVAGTVIGYNVYQSWNDTASSSFLKPRNTSLIPPAQCFYSDPPGVGVGSYYYKVAAVVLSATGDTLEGMKSPVKVCNIDVPSTGKVFIDNGATYTVDKLVSVSLSPIDSFATYEVLADSGVLLVDANKVKGQNPIANVLLTDGGGKKTVCVRVSRKDGSAPYVLTSFISVQPYNVRINVRNTDLRTSKEIKESFGGRITRQKKILFDVRTYKDPTFSDTFDVWLVVNPDGIARIKELTYDKNDKAKVKLGKTSWLETPPVAMVLDTANEDKIYEYDLEAIVDSTSKVVITPGGAKGTFDTNTIISTRTAGKLWGAKGIDTTGFNASGDYTDPHSLFYLAPSKSGSKIGVKEFYIVARFKGKNFNDYRYVISRTSKHTTYYWDFCPPSVVWDAKIKDTPENGDIVSSSFNVRFSASGSVVDGGKASPTEVELCFVKATGNEVMSDFKYEDIFKSRHISYIKKINTTLPSEPDVKWINIVNPIKPGAEWPTGNYIMVVVTTDDWGNRGIAPSEGDNPRMLYIKTSK